MCEVKGIFTQYEIKICISVIFIIKLKQCDFDTLYMCFVIHYCIYCYILSLFKKNYFLVFASSVCDLVHLVHCLNQCILKNSSLLEDYIKVYFYHVRSQSFLFSLLTIVFMCWEKNLMNFAAFTFIFTQRRNNS